MCCHFKNDVYSKWKSKVKSSIKFRYRQRVGRSDEFSVGTVSNADGPAHLAHDNPVGWSSSVRRPSNEHGIDCLPSANHRIQLWRFLFRCLRRSNDKCSNVLPHWSACSSDWLLQTHDSGPVESLRSAVEFAFVDHLPNTKSPNANCRALWSALFLCWWSSVPKIAAACSCQCPDRLKELERTTKTPKHKWLSSSKLCGNLIVSRRCAKLNVESIVKIWKDLFALTFTRNKKSNVWFQRIFKSGLLCFRWSVRKSRCDLFHFETGHFYIHKNIVILIFGLTNHSAAN